jgi:dephospho-CoA kinase|tara:strand:- start:373 stop:942 length:570 start_codon:yes stop_codon:yes gene_type:complete
MIRIAVLGDIGSGKTYIAKLFGYPIFNADLEVAKIYKTNRKCFRNLKKKLPKYFTSFPTKKEEVIRAITDCEINLKKITNIIHPEIKKKLNIFLKNNKKEDIVILDIPLLLENKLNKNKDIIIFIQSKKKEVIKRLKKRDNFNLGLLNKFKKIQLSLSHKRKKSQFIIKNSFTNKSAMVGVRKILKKIL